MRNRKPLALPKATSEQWEAAFRKAERDFGRNKFRMWVLQYLAHDLREEVAAIDPATGQPMSVRDQFESECG